MHASNYRNKCFHGNNGIKRKLILVTLNVKRVLQCHGALKSEPDVSPLTSLWHPTQFRRMLKTVAYKMGSFWIYSINQL